MVIRRFSSNLSPKTPLRILLVAGVSSVALAAVAVLLFVRTVQADALLPRPAVTAPPAAPIASVTPASLAPQKTNDLLHGFASWYGGVFNGRKTASGQLYNMYEYTACHPTLPFGSVVRVKNLRNLRTVDVRITDRGYLYEGRIIDLSYAAAKKLSMTKPGVAPVELEVISLGQSGEDK
jgi:rare lipoprotein A